MHVRVHDAYTYVNEYTNLQVYKFHASIHFVRVCVRACVRVYAIARAYVGVYFICAHTYVLISTFVLNTSL